MKNADNLDVYGESLSKEEEQHLADLLKQSKYSGIDGLPARGMLPINRTPDAVEDIYYNAAKNTGVPTNWALGTVKQESSSGQNLLGVPTKHGQAVGASQLLPKNWKKYAGMEPTKENYSNPYKSADATMNMAKNLSGFGDPTKMSKEWFSGNPNSTRPEVLQYAAAVGQKSGDPYFAADAASDYSTASTMKDNGVDGIDTMLKQALNERSKPEEKPTGFKKLTRMLPKLFQIAAPMVAGGILGGKSGVGSLTGVLGGGLTGLANVQGQGRYDASVKQNNKEAEQDKLNNLLKLKIMSGELSQAQAKLLQDAMLKTHNLELTGAHNKEMENINRDKSTAYERKINSDIYKNLTAVPKTNKEFSTKIAKIEVSPMDYQSLFENTSMDDATKSEQIRNHLETVVGLTPEQADSIAAKLFKDFEEIGLEANPTLVYRDYK